MNGQRRRAWRSKQEARCLLAGLLCLGATVAATALIEVDDPPPEPEEPPATLQSNLLQVSTLNTPEAARAFQRDVASMQAQRNRAIELQ